MANITYIRCRWHHDFADAPIDIWSEIGSDGFELRKLEYFRNGTVGYANHSKTTEASTGTFLGDQKIPSIDEIARDPQFEPEEVSRVDFEAKWSIRHP